MKRKHIYITVDGTQYRLDIDVKPNDGFSEFKIVGHEKVNHLKCPTGQFVPPIGEVAPYTQARVS